MQILKFGLNSITVDIPINSNNFIATAITKRDWESDYDQHQFATFHCRGKILKI